MRGKIKRPVDVTREYFLLSQLGNEPLSLTGAETREYVEFGTTATTHISDKATQAAGLAIDRNKMAPWFQNRTCKRGGGGVTDT